MQGFDILCGEGQEIDLYFYKQSAIEFALFLNEVIVLPWNIFSKSKVSLWRRISSKFCKDYGEFNGSA